jgi:hypothetical protein
VGSGNQNLDLGVTVVCVKLAGAVLVRQEQVVYKAGKLPCLNGTVLNLALAVWQGKHGTVWPGLADLPGFCLRLRPSCIGEETSITN